MSANFDIPPASSIAEITVGKSLVREFSLYIPGLVTCPIIETLIGLFSTMNNSTFGFINSFDNKFSRYIEALEIVRPLSFTAPSKGIIAFPSFKILVWILNSSAPITEKIIVSPEPSKYKSS